MQVPPPQAREKPGTAIAVGELKLKVLVAKLALNFHRLSELLPKLRKYSEEPAGAATPPSRSAGSRPP